jgi:hypothetical protein
MFRRLRTAAILAVAAGGPYLASETEWGKSAMSTVSGVQSQDNNGASTGYANAGDDRAFTNAVGYANHAHYEIEKLRRTDMDRYRYDEQLAKKLGGINADSDSKPHLVGSRVDDLREVMRFDISPDWVLQRFARVSTVLADLQLEGLRVPIVTGTRADDLAGTLTYYFDRTGKLQRVTLHGFTGDPNRLVGTMTQNYDMSREPSLEAGVYTKRWNGQPVHFLRMTHAPVVYSDAIHQKYTVFLELNQPNLIYGISPEARRIVNSDRMSGRW